MWITADAINAAIAAGQAVTARHADLPRAGQPARGTIVTVTRAYDGRSGVRVEARGYRGRFGVDQIAFAGETADQLRADATDAL